MNRIVQVAKGELENTEDPKFKHDVDIATQSLSQRMYAKVVIICNAVETFHSARRAKHGVNFGHFVIRIINTETTTAI